MSTQSVALAAAAIGAGGAIAGQIVASLFTARRERARLRSEEQRHFGDVRREVFGQFLHMARDARDAIVLVELESEPKLEAARFRMKEECEPLLEKMSALQSDISLLAPEVKAYAFGLLKYLGDWQQGLLQSDPEDLESGVGGFFMRLDECEWVMRGNLGVPFKRPKVVRVGQSARRTFRRS